MSILSDYIEETVDNRGRNPKYYEKEKYPVIDNVLIKNFIRPDINAVARYIDEDTYQNFLRGYIHKNMPIMTLVGSGIGNVSLAPSDRYVIVQNTIGYQVKDNLDEIFLYYYFLDNQERIRNYNRGSGQPSIRKTDILGMEVTIPIIATQKKIASVLYAIDKKILLNNEINDNLEQQARLVFDEWINTCTDKCTISELSENILDYTPISDGMVRLLNSSDVTEGVFPIAPLVPNEDLKGHFKKRFQFGDILYSEIRPRNHHYGFCQFDASKYIASTRLMVIRARESKVSPAVLYQYLLLPDVEAEFTLKTESRSGTFPQGNYADMSSIVIPYASLDKQKEISATLTSVRRYIAANQMENQRLAELRDTLLPKLMSGELDVSNIEI